MGSSKGVFLNERFPTSLEVWEKVENFVRTYRAEVTTWPVTTVNS
jgi:hypothetical protein